MRRMAYSASALVVCCALVLQATSPAPQQATPSFRAGVDLVQMDVSVLDKDRRPVKGLTQADFTILESGVSQPIVEFEAVDLPDTETVSAAWMRDAAVDVVTNDRAARRIVVIVLDDAFVPLDRTNEVKRTAREVVARLGANDLGAVAFTDSGHRQDITFDHDRLLKAIDSFVPHGSSGQRGLSLECALRGKFRSAASCVIDTLVTAGRALLEAPQGRKTLVYISGGFKYARSAEDLHNMEPGTPLPHPTQMFEEMLAIQQALTNLQRANVNVYAIDPSGVTQDGIMGAEKDWLRIFSEETGGRATMFTNTPWEAVPQIFRENSSYYLLAFRRTNTVDDGSFRKVQVKVNRRDVEVRARSGYTAPDAAAAAAYPSVKDPIDKAIQQSMPGGELAIATTVAPFAVPGQKYAVVAIATLLRDPLASGNQTVEIATRALDGDCGECRKLPSTRQTASFTPRAGQTARGEVLTKLNLAPGNYEIRVAATLDGRVGSVLAHVDVPDFQKDKLAASGLLLTSNAPVATAESRLLAGLVPVVPTAAREFSRTTLATAFMRLYQGGAKVPEAVRVTATILDVANTKRLEETTLVDPAKFNAARSSDYRIDVPLAKLEPGAYLLSIEASVTKLHIKREARFWVK